MLFVFVFRLKEMQGEQFRMSVLCVLYPLAVFASLATLLPYVSYCKSFVAMQAMFSTKYINLAGRRGAPCDSAPLLK